MSTQALSPTITFNDFPSVTDGSSGGSQNPTAKDLLKAFMDDSASAASNGTGGAEAAKVYRGRSTAELIPKIQAELGSQAVVTARRSGLEGGIGGFFQRPFVEIEAHRGHPGIDIRDGEDALPPAPEAQATRALEERPEIENSVAHDPMMEMRSVAHEPMMEMRSVAPKPMAELRSVAPATFADALEDAGTTLVSASPRPPISSVFSPTQKALSAELRAKGLSESFVASLLDEAQVHVLPFNPRVGLRRAVRTTLERRIPKTAPLRGDGASIALVGPGGAGKSACQGALAARYEHGSLPVTCASIVLDSAEGSLQLLAPPRNSAIAAATKRAHAALSGPREQGIVLLDTPAFSPADAKGLKGLAQALEALALDRHVLVLPATMSAAAMAGVLRASAPLDPQALAITHVEESDELGVAVEAACAAGLAPEYLLAATRGELSIGRTDPSALAEMLLP